MSPAASSAHDEKPSDDLENSQADISRAGSLDRSKGDVDKSMIQALNDLKEKFKIVYRTDEQMEQ